MVGMRNVVAITSAKVLSLLPSESFLYDFAIFQVPIVKLIHQQCQIEADLSLYNVLARENTCLLSLYAGDRFHINMWMIENSQSSSIRGFYVFFVSDLDPRVRTLGYMVKLFAKVGLFFAFSFFFNKNFQVCDIGDASRGSLSSYAYILMMIFYLQVRMMQQFICWFSLQSDKIRITPMK